MDGKDSALPHSIEALWDLRDKASRKPRIGLNLERIVTAAVELADAEGLAALSMAKVAQRLGSATMSLYRHVSSKDELQAFMLDFASGQPPVMDGDIQWRDGLEQWARAFLDVFRAHPWMVQITPSGPPLEPGQLSWLEAGLQTLRATGIRPDEKQSVMLLMIGYVRNHAQLFLAAGSDPEIMSGYGPTLARLITPDSFPALVELVEAGTFDKPADDFTFGLDRVLDGIEALIRR